MHRYQDQWLFQVCLCSTLSSDMSGRWHCCYTYSSFEDDLQKSQLLIICYFFSFPQKSAWGETRIAGHEASLPSTYATSISLTSSTLEPSPHVSAEDNSASNTRQRIASQIVFNKSSAKFQNCVAFTSTAFGC